MPVINRSTVGGRPPFSDDGYSDSDSDGFDYGGEVRSKYIPVSALNKNEAVADYGGEDEQEDWEERTPPPKEDDLWGHSPAEGVRLACKRGNLNKLKEFLSTSYTVGINQFFKGTEENPLIAASIHAKLEIIEYLMKEKSANPNLKHPLKKITPLMAIAGCVEEYDNEILLKCATALVEGGADMNVQDAHGMTALMIAIKRRRNSISNYLISQKADLNLQEVDGKTALFFAAAEGDGPMCRQLLENGADIHIVDRFGWTAYDIAQEKNFPRLAELLHLARVTKWKPGLEPRLMKEMDEESAKKGTLDNFSIKEDSAVEMAVTAADGEKYVENFRKHKITYLQFMTLDEDQLKEIGVEELGIRERILDHIKKINSADWHQSSLRRIPVNKAVTAAEAVCMIVNIKDHLAFVGRTLRYLKDRIQKKPLDLKFDKERNRIRDLMKLCEETERNSQVVGGNAMALYELLGTLKGCSELQVVGSILPEVEDEKKNSSLGTSILLITIVGVGVSFALKFYRGLFW